MLTMNKVTKNDHNSACGYFLFNEPFTTVFYCNHNAGRGITHYVQNLQTLHTTCMYTSNLLDCILWTTIQLFLSLSQITILNVNMSAGGRYTCIATGEQVQTQSRQSSRSQHFAFCSKFWTCLLLWRVKINSSLSLPTALPTIIITIATPNPVVGEEFSIEYTVAGTPVPTIRWQFNDRTLENGNNFRILETLDGQTSIVEVTDATTENSGVYTCIVSNDAGNVNQLVRIKLQCKYMIIKRQWSTLLPRPPSPQTIHLCETD